jgi:large subunit ribosomal protein L22
MEIKAKAKHVKISPRKVRLVASLVRGAKVGEALNQLSFTNKNAAKPVGKLVKSAVANAENSYDLEKDNLFIKEIIVNEGPTLHRWMPKARGRATPIRKRTSHIDIVLGELVDSGNKKAKIQKVDKPVKLDNKPKEDEGVKIADNKDKKENSPANAGEKEASIIDPRGEGKGKHTKIEGKNQKGFVSKMFRRKSG